MLCRLIWRAWGVEMLRPILGGRKVVRVAGTRVQVSNWEVSGDSLGKPGDLTWIVLAMGFGRKRGVGYFSSSSLNQFWSASCQIWTGTRKRKKQMPGAARTVWLQLETLARQVTWSQFRVHSIWIKCRFWELWVKFEPLKKMHNFSTNVHNFCC
jgi:hypothetical protein